MAQWIVRNLDGESVKKLELEVAREVHSAAAEHRAIQRLSPLPERSLQEHLLSMPAVGGDADFERAPDLGRKVDL